MAAATGDDAMWAKAKKLCRLDEADIRMAKQLGMTPKSLIKNIPGPSQHWKAPVKEWIRSLHAHRYGQRSEPAPVAQPLPEPPEEPLSGWIGEGEDAFAAEETALSETDSFAMRRQRQLRRAAEAVARAFAEFPFVQSIEVFGSVAKPLFREPSRYRRLRRLGPVLHECNDVDLAVYVTDLSRLIELRRAMSVALGKLQAEYPDEFGVTHLHVDVMFLEHQTLRYRGALCHYGTCPKDAVFKRECRLDGCGAQPFLRLFENWRFDERVFCLERRLPLFDRAGAGLLEVQWPERVEEEVPRDDAIVDEDIPF